MEKIKVGSDFSGVGAFDQALRFLNIDYEAVFSCDMDKYARQSYIANYGEPDYYPLNVYNRDIPKKSLDIYMTSPPCQGFSLAGKRGGSILFLNSHEFIKINKPRFFIFENVKGLLSHEKNNKDAEFGNTFNQWINYLGGKSVNGATTIFPHEDSVPYHIYWKVLNAKKHGVPQNRERVFIIGIRDDSDNHFTWPKEEPLTKKLADILEPEVDEKYFLSDKMIKGLLNKNNQDNGFTFSPKTKENIGNCITARCFKMGADDNYIKVKSATNKGYEIAKEGDSINFSQPNSETRRGRVGYEVAQTLDTACNQGIIIHNLYGGFGEDIRIFKDYSPTIRTAKGGGHIPATIEQSRIRRLTPRECFRLMDFPDSFKFVVSDTQLYKQAGNSIVRMVLAKIIEKLPL